MQRVVVARAAEEHRDQNRYRIEPEDFSDRRRYVVDPIPRRRENFL